MKKIVLRIFYLILCFFIFSPTNFCCGAKMLSLLEGTITDSITGEMLDGVIITSDQVGAAISHQGAYQLYLVEGVQTVTARLVCYEPFSFIVTIEEGSEMVQRDILLVPQEECSCSGDVNNDGIVDFKDLLEKYIAFQTWIMDCWLPQLL